MLDLAEIYTAEDSVSDMCSKRVAAKRLKLLGRDGFACHWCGERFSSEVPPTLDHLWPSSKGGGHDVGNLVLACGDCNSRRGRKAWCTACGDRIRTWPASVIVARRFVYHRSCLRKALRP